MGFAGTDAVVLHQVEVIAHSLLHAFRAKNLDGVLAVALDAVVHEVQAVVVVHDGFAETVAVGRENDGRRLEQRFDHPSGDGRHDGTDDEHPVFYVLLASFWLYLK